VEEQHTFASHSFIIAVSCPTTSQHYFKVCVDYVRDFLGMIGWLMIARAYIIKDALTALTFRTHVGGTRRGDQSLFNIRWK
jgi:hypothetical protein